MISTKLKIFLKNYNIFQEFIQETDQTDNILIRDIDLAFNWSETVQGHSFWSTINDSFINIFKLNHVEIGRLSEYIFDNGKSALTLIIEKEIKVSSLKDALSLLNPTLYEIEASNDLQ